MNFKLLKIITFIIILTGILTACSLSDENKNEDLSLKGKLEPNIMSLSKTIYPVTRFRSYLGAGRNFSVGLKADGTVIGAGDMINWGRWLIYKWKNIIAIDVGMWHILGLKSDNTVVSEGYDPYNVSDWTNIISLAAGGYHSAALKTDGTVVAAGRHDVQDACDVGDWKDIIAVSAGESFTLGLKSDGTVIATARNTWWKGDVSSWKDIIAIEAGRYDAVGLKSDGTVITTIQPYDDRYDAHNWSNIVKISIKNRHIVGLKSDKTVVAAGNNDYNQLNVQNWTNIIAIKAGLYHTTGLKTDGRVVAVGWNKDGQCKVGDWKLASPPSLSLPLPIRKRMSQCDNYTIKAYASDNEFITKVEFYSNNHLIHTYFQPSYENVFGNFDYCLKSSDRKKIKAIAYDNEGFIKISKTIILLGPAHRPIPVPVPPPSPTALM